MIRIKPTIVCWLGAVIGQPFTNSPADYYLNIDWSTGDWSMGPLKPEGLLAKSRSSSPPLVTPGACGVPGTRKYKDKTRLKLKI